MYISNLLFVLVLQLLHPLVLSCEFHTPLHDISSLTTHNLMTRGLYQRKPHQEVLAIINARIFDGSCLQPPRTLVINSGYISGHSPHYDRIYDAKGRTLIPGLIDAHTHPTSISDLASLSKAGVTTAVNAFCPSPAFCNSLKGHTGLTSLISGSFIATTGNSTHAKLLRPEDADLLIRNIDDIPGWVEKQVSQGADFIKVIGSAPGPGLSQAAQVALVSSAHKFKRPVVQHVSSYSAYVQAIQAGADQIHHSTLDMPLDDIALSSLQKGFKACPTLTMMRAIVEQLKLPGMSYESAAMTVTRLHALGISILAGTDANSTPGAPAQVPFGKSLHNELENLVVAGLSPIEALNAATKVPAKHFGLNDRGRIAEGMRADLVLIDGDPTKDIRATQNIVKVWIGGLEYEDNL